MIQVENLVKRYGDHVAVVLAENSVKLYKDRQLLAKQELAQSIGVFGENLSCYLGKSLDSKEGLFQGAFDHVEIYNYARTAADIAKVDMVTISYNNSEGGSLEGKTSQTIQAGTTASPVTAKAESGWRFVRWSDGVETAGRQDVNVTEDRTVTAVFGKDGMVEKGLFASYDFEKVYEGFATDTSQNGNLLELHNGTEIQTDEIKDSQVLSLNGQGAYAKLPEGMFDGMDEMTILMDVRSKMGDQNFFTFAIGQGEQKYAFVRLRNNHLYFGMTNASYQNEQGVQKELAECQNEWMTLAIVLAPGSIKLYQDQELVAENNNMTLKLSDLGTNLKSYFGKSFFGGDSYFL